jgi:hypothetical protein
MKHASITAIAVGLIIFFVAPFQIVAFAQTGRGGPSPPSPTQTCRACVLTLSSCLRRCNEQNKSTPDRLTCVNACTETHRCVRGLTCTPNSP